MTNYTLVYQNGTLTVGKAPLTITAEDKTRKQGEANPDFTLLYSGFKNDEDATVLDALPSILCDATTESPTGFYDITLSGGSDNNYSYRLVNGKLEVTAATGIDNIAAGLTLYPNPAKHTLYIRSDAPIECLEIYNQAGVRVLVENKPTDKVDVSALPEGLYLVRLSLNGTTKMQKMLIQR